MAARQLRSEEQHGELPRTLVYDLDEGRMVVTTRQDLMFAAPLPPDADLAWKGVSKIRIDVQDRVQVLTLRDGPELELQLGGAGRDRPPDHVPIAYLDQNQWIALACSRWSPDRLTESEREAGEALFQLARVGEVILPLSSAHLGELPAAEYRRRDLVLTMLEVSKGWQMRSPLTVRRQELRGAIGTDPAWCQDAFTLEPGAVFGEPSRWSPSLNWPPEVRDLLVRVVASNSSVAAMLEEDRPEDITGIEERRRWLRGFSEQARRLAPADLSATETRALAHAALLQDMKSELAEAAAYVGLGASELEGWLADDSRSAFESAPHIRILSEVLYHRFRNPQDQWEENDLFDMQFLTAAAGYADLVVAEKKFGDYISRARRRFPQSAPIATSLTGAVAILSSVGCRHAA